MVPSSRACCRYRVSIVSFPQSYGFTRELERLLLELTYLGINAICLELDIASLFVLWQVNLRARHIVIHCQNTDLLLITLSTASVHYCGRSQLDELHRPAFNVFSVIIIKLCSLCGTIYGDLVHYLIQ